MSQKKPSQPRVKFRNDQLELLVSFMESNDEFHKGTLTKFFTAKMKNKMWQDLARQLNAKGGAVKSVQKWQKCWSDYKAWVKKKYFQLKQYIPGPGAGPPPRAISPLEERILKLISQTCDGLDVEESLPSSYYQIHDEVEVLMENQDDPDDFPMQSQGGQGSSEDSQHSLDVAYDVLQFMQNHLNGADSTKDPQAGDTKHSRSQTNSTRDNITQKGNSMHPTSRRLEPTNATSSNSTKPITSRNRGIVTAGEKTESPINMQEGTASALMEIALQMDISNSLKKEKLLLLEQRNAIQNNLAQIEKRKASALETIAHYFVKKDQL